MIEIVLEVKKGIRSGTLDINSAFVQISGHAERHAGGLRENGKEIIEEVKQELERKIRKGYLDEALDSIEKTLDFISSIRIEEPKNVDEREVENRYAEYINTLSRSFNWIGTIDRKFSAVMEKIGEYAQSKFDQAEYRAKLEMREELREYLERKRDEISDFKLKIETLKPLKWPGDVNVVFVGVEDLLIPFELELDLDKIEKSWISENMRKIIEKTENSLKPKLNASMLSGIDEGWMSAGEFSGIHDKKFVMVAPQYAEIDEEEFDHVLRGKGKNVTVYKLVFGINFPEVVV